MSILRVRRFQSSNITARKWAHRGARHTALLEPVVHSQLAPSILLLSSQLLEKLLLLSSQLFEKLLLRAQPSMRDVLSGVEIIIRVDLSSQLFEKLLLRAQLSMRDVLSGVEIIIGVEIIFIALLLLAHIR